MKNLYALVVNGRMFYFIGMIDESKFDLIDNIAKKINFVSSDYDHGCKEFIEVVKNEFGIDISQINITYIFRK